LLINKIKIFYLFLIRILDRQTLLFNNFFLTNIIDKKRWYYFYVHLYLARIKNKEINRIFKITLNKFLKKVKGLVSNSDLFTLFLFFNLLKQKLINMQLFILIFWIKKLES